MALAREQITIVDLHDGVDGSSYSLNILGGTRTISYNATGKSPTPAQTAYSCELYKNGVKVTPSSYAWSASGHLSGTSTAAGFTPTAVETYNASLTSSNVVSLTVAYKGMVFKGTVQVVVTKAATDAKLITLVADSQVFKVVGKTVSPTTAKITAETQNTSVTAWTYSSNGAAFTGTLPDGVTRSGSTVTVTGASMTAQTIAVKASDGTYSDVMTIVKVADGGRGEPGKPAVQPVTGFLTNESVTFPADFEGNVTGHTGPLGSFKVFQGTTDVTASASFTASNNVGGAVSISDTGVYTLNSLAADRASVDLKAVYGGVSIVKTLTISKSRAGTPGPVGRAVDKIDVMYYSSTSPTTQENGSWSTNAPAWVNGRFIWSKTVTTYTEGTPPTTSSLPILLTGATGNTGRGIKSITEQYALTKDKKTAPDQGSSLWKDAAPTWTSGSYMWTRSKIVYLNSDGSETTTYVGVSVDTAWEAVNEIKVGGRNLLLNSSELTMAGANAGGISRRINEEGHLEITVEATNGNYVSGLGITLTNNHDLKDGDIVTLSVQMKSANATGTPDLYLGTGMTYKKLDGDITEEFSTIKHTRVWNYIGGWYPHMGFGGRSGVYVFKNIKLEKGNIATDWTPAPEDVEKRLVSHDARIDTNEKEIALRATKKEVGAIDTRLSAAEVMVEPGSIVSTVRKSTEYVDDQGKKVSTNEIISKINQSAEKIQIEASKINIKGAVEFSSFDSDLQDNLNKRARTFTSTPVPPYSLGDIWKNSTSTYMCKVARATGSYVSSDWEKTGDVTSANTAKDTERVGGTAAATVVTGATAGSEAKTATDRWTYKGKTTINGGQIEADTITAAQIKGKTITAKEIEAHTITVDELASSVGSSLDLSSNEAITSRVTSTELGTALKGKEDSIFIQDSAPSHKVGRLWLDTSTATNQLKRSDGTKWVVVSDIKVGGKNLVLDSTNGGKGWTSTAYNVIPRGQLSEDWVVGETYTISIKGSVNSSNRFGVWRDTGSVAIGRLMSYNPSTGVHTQTYTNLRDTTQPTKNLFSVYNVPSESASQAKIEWIKIEKGSVATDWTPAPEDIEADLGALAKRVSSAELNIKPESIKSTVETQVKNNGSTVLATKSDITQTETDWTAKFSSIGGENLYEYSENLLNRFWTYGGSAYASDYPKYVDVPEYNVNNAVHLRSTAVGDSVLRLYTTVALAESLESGEPYTMSFYIKNNRTDEYMEVRSNRWPGIERLEAGETKRMVFSGVGSDTEPAQIQLRARNIGYYIDCTVWHVKLERGWVATEYSTKLYTGVTKINKDGVEVSRSDSDIKTKLAHDGTHISDAHGTIAVFGGTTYMPFANIDKIQSEDVVGTVTNPDHSAGNYIYEIGKGKDFTTVSGALDAIFTDGSRRFLINDTNINLYLNGTIEDEVLLKGIAGNGKIYIYFRTGAKLYGYIKARDCMNRIYIRSLTTTGTGRGMIIANSPDVDYAVFNEASKHVHLISMDINAKSKTAAVQGNDAGTTILDNCDLVGSNYGTWCRYSHTLRTLNCRGNATNGHYADQLGIQLIGGSTCVKGSSANVNQASTYGGLSLTSGTIAGTNSGFSPPPTSDKTFVQTFRAISLRTKTSTGEWQTYYGSTAAQNRWASTSPHSVGQITFSSDVYRFIADRKTGTTPTIKIRMRRKNTSHGASAAIKPDPANFSSTAFSSAPGAVQGGWTGWGNLTVSNFNTSGNTLLTIGTGKTDVNYNPSRYYAIWDIAEIEVTKIKNV